MGRSGIGPWSAATSSHPEPSDSAHPCSGERSSGTAVPATHWPRIIVDLDSQSATPSPEPAHSRKLVTPERRCHSNGSPPCPFLLDVHTNPRAAHLAPLPTKQRLQPILPIGVLTHGARRRNTQRRCEGST